MNNTSRKIATNSDRLVFLNEATIVPATIAAICRRPFVLIQARANLRFFDPALRRAAVWLAQWFPATVRTDPDFTAIADIGFLQLHRDAFASSEKWLERRFRFAEADRGLGEDALPFRKSVTNYFQDFVVPFRIVEEIDRKFPSGAVVWGVESDVVDLFAWTHRRPPRFSLRFRPRSGLPPALGLGLALGALLKGLIQLVRCVRLRVEPKLQPVLGVDYMNVVDDLAVFREIFPDPRDFILVERAPGWIRSQPDVERSFPWTRPSNGAFPVSEFLGRCGTFLRGWFKLASFALRFPNRLLVPVLGIAVMRARYAAFFRRYPVRAFWGRDDYNVDHIVRGQELRKIGGVSIGIMHGMPNRAIRVPQYRYVDFDHYFLHGLDLRRYYQDTWPAHMNIRTFGSYSLTQDRLHRLNRPRPRDILYLPNAMIAVGDRQTHAIAALAEAFPDRTVVVRLRRPGHEPVRAAESIAAAHANVCLSHENTFELLLRSRYCVSIPSTVVSEAILFGCVSFVFDFDRRESNIYRDYPGLCVSGIEEIIERIRSIEAGREVWRRDNFAGLIDLSLELPVDKIRSLFVEIGLIDRPSNIVHRSAC